MSPIISQTKQCPDCLADAHLTGWKSSAGYDPKMRQYLCPKCGNEFYVIGGEKTHKIKALPLYS